MNFIFLIELLIHYHLVSIFVYHKILWPTEGFSMSQQVAQAFLWWFLQSVWCILADWGSGEWRNQMLGHCPSFRQTPFGRKREGPNHHSNGSCLDCYISRYWNNSLYNVWWSLFFCKSFLERTCDSCKLCWCRTLFLDKIKWFWY